MFPQLVKTIVDKEEDNEKVVEYRASITLVSFRYYFFAAMLLNYSVIIFKPVKELFKTVAIVLLCHFTLAHHAHVAGDNTSGND